MMTQIGIVTFLDYNSQLTMLALGFWQAIFSELAEVMVD